MKITDFTQQPEVVKLISDLKNEQIQNKEFSDVLDEQNNQYVEFVQEGGGVLGVALVGYAYVLEQLGIRFFSLAGTSAGSINALLLASLGNVSQPKSEKIIQILANKNLYDFVDGDRDARDFIKCLVEKAKILKLAWKGMQVIDNLTLDLGLNPGDDFTRWLSGILKENGISTTRDLYDTFGKVPEGLKIRQGVNRSIEGLNPRFAVITADLTTETKVEFPKMRSLYWKNADEINPALFVRASMSVPYFFKPLKIKGIPKGDVAIKNWEDQVKFCGKLPDSVFLVDGGIMSNFPIDIFHKVNSIPRLPTFGVRLGVNRQEYNKITSPINLFGAMFNSLRHLHDYDFILKNPDYEMLVHHILIGDHNWLNFGLTNEAKVDLFKRGAQAASEFLRKFNWHEYKRRRGIIKTVEK
jgi:NTE family protein